MVMRQKKKYALKNVTNASECVAAGTTETKKKHERCICGGRYAAKTEGKRDGTRQRGGKKVLSAPKKVATKSKIKNIMFEKRRIQRGALGGEGAFEKQGMERRKSRGGGCEENGKDEAILERRTEKEGRRKKEWRKGRKECSMEEGRRKVAGRKKEERNGYRKLQDCGTRVKEGRNRDNRRREE